VSRLDLVVEGRDLGTNRLFEMDWISQIHTLVEGDVKFRTELKHQSPVALVEEFQTPQMGWLVAVSQAQLPVEQEEECQLYQKTT
jgi:hypothetical protein